MIDKMKKPMRNLLVLFNQELMSHQAIEHEVDLLHQLLSNIEHPEKLLSSHEILDLNKYKVINNPIQLRKLLKAELKPFVFLNNKN